MAKQIGAQLPPISILTHCFQLKGYTTNQNQVQTQQLNILSIIIYKNECQGTEINAQHQPGQRNHLFKYGMFTRPY